MIDNNFIIFQTLVSSYFFYKQIYLVLFTIIWFRIIAVLFPSFWIIFLNLDLKCEMLKMLALAFSFVTFIKLIVTKSNILLVYILYITHNLWKDLSWRFDISFNFMKIYDFKNQGFSSKLVVHINSIIFTIKRLHFASATLYI